MYFLTGKQVKCVITNMSSVHLFDQSLILPVKFKTTI